MFLNPNKANEVEMATSAVEQVWCWRFGYWNLSPGDYLFVLFRSLVSSFSAHINVAFSCSRQ